ncbi:hypothetical protein ACIQUG_14435 [Ensifer sp. NPDC090286]|nr:MULTISPECIES: hypothetical protein [unclassified Ensifer]
MNNNGRLSGNSFAAPNLRDRLTADGLAYLVALMPVFLLLC